MKPSASSSGRILRGRPYSLELHNTVSIGSARSCDIVIEGADPHHAELRWDANDEAWRIIDDPAPGVTLRNGAPVASAVMLDGDWIEIAGARVGFKDGKLVELSPDTPLGLRVSVRNVSASVKGRRLLEDVSLEIKEGAFTAILGPSGCGKSTLIQRIAGLAKFDGEILINGHSVCKEKRTLQPLLEYLPQSVDETLFGDLTTSETLDDFALRHLPTAAKPNSTKILESVGLDTDIMDTPVQLLSGGQKRRLALALALMRNPQLLLLDEPTAGLDPAAEAGIMELLRNLAERGITVVCATHVLSSLDFCDEVAVMAKGGRLAFHGSTSDAKAHFGCQDWFGIYRKLEKPEFGDFTTDCCEVHANEVAMKLPVRPPVAPFGASFRANFARLRHAVAGSPKKAALCCGLPMLLSVLLMAACGSQFTDAGPHETIYFCTSVAVFLLGVLATMMNLVGERVPKRCLDRMRGASLSCYFLAHVVFAGVLAAVLPLFFLLPLFLAKFAYGPFSIWAFPPFWAILAPICFAGGCVGLFISAIAKKELHSAMWFLIVMLLALFISKPVLEGRGSGPDGDGLSVAQRGAEHVMPTYYPQHLLEAEMDAARGKGRRDEAHNYRKWLALLALCYPALFIPLAVISQTCREKQWDGR